MAILRNTVSFAGLAVGVPTSLPHGLLQDGAPVVPDLLLPDGSGFTITADDTNITVTRPGAGIADNVNVLAVRWHTVTRALAPGLVNLTPQPIVPSFASVAPPATVDMGLNNVQDFGAAGDGATDDRAAIQAAIDDAVANGIAGIYFPPGTYNVSKSTAGGSQHSMILNGISNLMILGRAGKSVVRQVGSGGGGDWYMWRITNGCDRILFQDLTLDGSEGTGLITDLDEQTHIVDIKGVTGPTTNIKFKNVLFTRAHGDGLRLVGAIGTEVRWVDVSGCYFIDNKRAGLSIQRATQGVWLHDSYLAEGPNSSDQLIDHEPTGNGTTEDHIYDNNLMIHNVPALSVTLGGNGATQRNMRCRFTNNILVGGQVRALNISEMIFKGNIITGNPNAIGNEPSLQFFRAVYNCDVSDNWIQCPARASTNASVFKLVHNAGFNPINNRVRNNTFLQFTTAACCNFESPQGLEFSGNDLIYQGPANVDSIAVFRAIIVDLDRLVISRNSFRNLSGQTVIDGATITASNGAGTVDVQDTICNDNYFENFTIGIRYTVGGVGEQFLVTPVAQRNTFVNVPTGIETGTLGTFNLGVCVGGSVGGGSPPDLMGTGDPENTIAAPVGSTWRRTDGGVGTSLYVKEVGAGNTGWAAK